MANIMKGLGGNAPSIKLPKGYELKTGSMTSGAANSNPNVIPITIKAYGASGNTVTPQVKYGNNVLGQMGYYLSSNNSFLAYLSVLPFYDFDYTKVTKQKLSSNFTYSMEITVLQWLEKVGGGVINSFLGLLRHSFHTMKGVF